MPEPDITVVVPTLNEEPTLAACLRQISRQTEHVVVVDGGSHDGTAAVARRYGARVTTSLPGRGHQLNAGASEAPARGYLFVHADTLVPDDAVYRASQALAGGAEGGGFLVRFDSRRLVYRFGSSMVNLRTRLTRLPLGDQAQFVSRQAFDRLGGFRDWPILEDLDFIRRLRRLGRIEILSPPVVTSPRRFERYGPVRTLATNWVIFALFTLGVSPRRLHRLYPAPGADQSPG